MAPSKLVTTSVGFQDAKGTVVANGALTLTLSQPAEIIATGGLVDAKPIYLPLDVNGKITSTAIWFNDELTPSGTTYHAVLYDSNLAQILADFGQWSIAGASADLSTMVPTTSGASYPGAVLLVPAGNQTITTGNLSLSSGSLTGPNLNNFIFVGSGTGEYSTLAAAYTALPSTGGTILVSPGTYTGSLTLTGGKPVRLIGSGTDITIFIPSASNTPVIQMPTSGQADHCYFAGFSVKAHASGSTGPAIDLNGTRNSIFEHIEYLSNSGANFNSFFHLSANNLCYGNTIRHASVDTQTGPATVILFDNNGTSNANFNANNNFIEDIWINANTGITTVIDARRSANTVITRGLIESNTGAVVLIPGTNTIMMGMWLESNASTSIVGTTGADGTSNGVKIIGNQVSTSQTWTIQSSSDNWMILGNFPDSSLTVTDNSGGGTTNLIQTGMTFRGTQNDLTLHVKNQGTNGIDWGIISATGSGGVGYNGGLAFRDLTNSKIGFVLNPNNGDAVFGDPGANQMKFNTGVVTMYKNVATAGMGVSPIYGSTSQKSESAADTNVLTFTPPAVAGTYRLRFILTLSAANAATLGWTASWKDSNGSSKTPTNLALTQAGTASTALTFTTSAADMFYGEAHIDVDNSATNIVVKLTFTGTSFTGKASATIERLQ